jgi:hypothetical protein
MVFLRKEINYLGLRVEHLLMIQKMRQSNEAFHFNPTALFKFKHDVSLNVNNIKLTILKALNYLKYTPDDSDISNITKNENNIQEENGILNYLF